MKGYGFLMSKSRSSRANFALRYGPVEEMRRQLLALPDGKLATHFVAEKGQAHWFAPKAAVD
jgi:hypothetical protein